MAFQGNTYQPKGLSQQYNSQLGAISNMMQGNSAMASNIADNRNATIRTLANTFLQEQMKEQAELAKQKAMQDYADSLLPGNGMTPTEAPVVIQEQFQPTSSAPQIQNPNIFSNLREDEQFPPLTQNGSTTNWNQFYGVPPSREDLQSQPLSLSPTRQESLAGQEFNQQPIREPMKLAGGLGAEVQQPTRQIIDSYRMAKILLARGDMAAAMRTLSEGGFTEKSALDLLQGKASLEKTLRENRIGEATEGSQIGKIKADATTAEVTARNNQVKFAASDPGFLYGGGAKNLAEGLKQSLDPATAPEATDISGVPLGVPINKEMISYRNNFARLPETRQGEIVEATRDSALTLDRYLDLRDRSLQAAKEGRLRRIQTKIGADGLPAVVLPNDADEAELTAKEFFDARNALAIKRALASGQAANSISNKDAQAFANVIGDPTAPPELFIRQSNAFAAEMLVPAINNAQAVSAPDFQRLNLFYRDLVGEDYKFERTRPITDIVEKMNVRARIRLGLDNNQKFQSISAPSRSAKPTTKTPPGRLTQILGDLDEEI